MRANIPYRITNKQKAAIRNEVAEEHRRQGEANHRRLFKLMCAVLNKRRKFGKGRLMETIDDISKLAAEHEHDEVFWRHIDMLMEQLGLEFEKENYEEMDR